MLLNHYFHSRLTDSCYIITEDYGVHSRYTIGLYIGNDAAAVIDSGWGLTGNLRRYIERNITDKPLICLLTHAHPDHIGACAQFDRIFMNPLDTALAEKSRSRDKRLGDMRMRFEGTELFSEMEAEATDFPVFCYEPVCAGQSFQLGGVNLTAISVPGHTPGSMVFYCAEENIAFVGDAVGNRVTLLDPSAGLDKYVRGINKLIGLFDGDTLMFGGHSQSPMRKSLLCDIAEACENILTGRANPVPAELPAFMLADLNGKLPLAESVGQTTVVYRMIEYTISNPGFLEGIGGL